MKKKRYTLAGIAGATALLLAAGPASADVQDIPDPVLDAFALTTSNITYGSYDIDLTNVRIDHQAENVVVTSTFSYTNIDSWTQIRAQFDINGDRIPDYAALWGKDPSGSGVLQYNADGSYVTVCTAIGTGESMGLGGSATMTVPRSCIGNPQAVGVHLDVAWIGTNTYGYPLSFGDSAPGQLIDNPVTFSAPVPVAATVVVPSPAPPAPVVQKKATKVFASVAPKNQQVGHLPATVTVRIKGSGNPDGKVKVTANGRFVKQLRAWKGKTFKVRLPTSLKPGVQRVKVAFTPFDLAEYDISSKTVKLRVRR